MSTDYGFKCLDCEEKKIVGNARYCDVSTLQQIIGNIEAISKVKSISEIEITVAGWYAVREALEFVEHHKLKHKHRMVVCDQYGREYDQCAEYAFCTLCGHSTPCVLKYGHESGHETKMAKRIDPTPPSSLDPDKSDEQGLP